MKKTLLTTLAMGLLLCSSGRALAQDMKPIAVVSLSGYDNLMKDVGYVGELMNKPELAQTGEGLIKLFTANQGLVGLDKSKPWGGIVSTDGATFPKAIFLPVTDVDKFLGALKGLVGDASDVGNGVKQIEIQANQMPLFLKPVGGWLYIGQTAEDLADLPKDPAAVLGGMDKEYDIGVRAFAQNVPEIFKQIGIQAITDGLENSLQPQDGESDEDFEVRKKAARAQLDQMVTSINDLETITLGISIDQAGKRLVLDVASTVKDGSASASQLADNKDLTSAFSGFVQPDGIFSFGLTSKVGDAEKPQTLAQLAAAKDQLKKELAKSQEFPNEETKAAYGDLMNDLFGVLEGAVKSGKLDGGVSVVGAGPVTVAVGLHLGEGSDGVKLTEKIVGLVNSEGHLKEFKKAFAKQGDVTFHSLTVKVPDDEKAQKVAKVFGGQNLDLTVGTSKDKLYLAVGAEGYKELQNCIAKSAAGASAPAMPVSMSLALAPVMKLASEAEDAKPETAEFAQMLAAGGKDHMRITYIPIPNGAKMRVEVEEGLLKLMGVAAEKVQAARAAAQN